MNNKYATAVMSEHQNNFTTTGYDCDRMLFSQHDNNCLQHHVYQERPTYVPVHNEVPTSSYLDNRITANVSWKLENFPQRFKLSWEVSPAQSGVTNAIFLQNELTYADLTILQKPHSLFSSATLGRPRHGEIKRAIEPSIYAQVSTQNIIHRASSNVRAFTIFSTTDCSLNFEDLFFKESF